MIAIAFNPNISFADMKSSPTINETQFQLKVNQTLSLQSDGIKVKFLNVTADSRCPSDVTCIWQGEAKVLVNILENNQNHDGNFSLTSSFGQQDLAVPVFDGYSIRVVKVDPYPSSSKKIPLSDYLVTFAMSKSDILSPLKQFKSGISVMDVKCSLGYILTIKSEDNSPACVRPLTVMVLSEVGWSKFESTQSNHATNAKTNPFGIVGLMYYHGGGPCGVGVCPLNTFNLKMNSNYTAYLLGYHICDDNSCIVRNDLSTLLPLNVIGTPNYKFIALPENPQWKYGDVFHIQVEVSSIPDNKTAVWTDLGNSTIIH